MPEELAEDYGKLIEYFVIALQRFNPKYSSRPLSEENVNYVFDLIGKSIGSNGKRISYLEVIIAFYWHIMILMDRAEGNFIENDKSSN